MTPLPPAVVRPAALPMNSIRNPIFCNESIQSSDLMNKIRGVLRESGACLQIESHSRDGTSPPRRRLFKISLARAGITFEALSAAARD